MRIQSNRRKSGALGPRRRPIGVKKRGEGVRGGRRGVINNHGGRNGVRGGWRGVMGDHSGGESVTATNGGRISILIEKISRCRLVERENKVKIGQSEPPIDSMVR